MFRLNVAQNAWVMLAIAGGLVLVIMFALTMIAMWRPREEFQGPSVGRSMPWVLIVSFLFVLAYLVIYTIWMIYEPPNI